MAKAQAAVIVAVVAVAAVAVGVFVATRGPGTTTVPTTTPIITTPTVTPITAEPEWCTIRFGYWLPADTLTTPSFTIQGPRFKVNFAIVGVTAPPDASVTLTVLTAEGNEPVASGEIRGPEQGPDFEETLVVQRDAGSSFLQLAARNAGANRGYVVGVEEPKEGNVPCPSTPIDLA
jgi:hypothetical protein